MKLNIICDVFGTTGYALHGRRLANALMDEGVDIRLETNLFSGWEQQCNDNELKAIKKENDRDRIAVMITQPQMWRYGLSTKPKKFIGFLVWEGDKIPKYWIPYLLDERVSQIWVPSQHTRHAINETRALCDISSKLMSKVHIIPHGIDKSIFYPEPKKHDKFTFICNKGWRGTTIDRGGVQFLIKAFTEEFENKENVKLILKLNPAYLPQNVDYVQLIANLKLPKNHAEIALNGDDLSQELLNKMYNDADIYICTQMADGFNMPGLEAMSCGLATIQTNFGGQTDYMTDKNSWKINYDLIDATDMNYEGVKWALPDKEDIKKKMRYAFEHQEEVKEKGKQALKDSENWTWKQTAKKAIKALNS
jgi:glycosyltransferase involved in cell wall biosynthesis